jgi:hypothetical protein
MLADLAAPQKLDKQPAFGGAFIMAKQNYNDVDLYLILTRV